MNELGQGWWCSSCEFFENEDPRSGKNRCPSCGCSHEDHIAAKVVSAE